jgi:hypothetical protein
VRDLDAVITEYVYELKARNRAAGTTGNYPYTIRLFTDWLATQDDPPAEVAEITRQHITRWATRSSRSGGRGRRTGRWAAGRVGTAAPSARWSGRQDPSGLLIEVDLPRSHRGPRDR